MSLHDSHDMIICVSDQHTTHNNLTLSTGSGLRDGQTTEMLKLHMYLTVCVCVCAPLLACLTDISPGLYLKSLKAFGSQCPICLNKSHS